LDPNAMSAEVWARLFVALKISDWDDHEVVVTPVTVPDWQDGDQLPELAQELARLRQYLPGGRITHLEQLLQADPQGGGTYKNLRHRLTRAELELLRPYLTLHNPGPGRRGLIDLGTVVAIDGKFPTWYLDSNPDPTKPLFIYDTALVGQNTDATTKTHARAFVRGGLADQPVVSGSWVSNKDLIAAVDERIAIEAPGVVNFHQMSGPVRVALGTGIAASTLPLATYPSPTIDALPAPVPDSLIVPADDPLLTKIYRTTGALSQVFVPGTPAFYTDLYPFISPLGRAGSGNFRSSETPPIGVRSLGVFAIEASSHVMDPLGRQTAQELRRDIVQAVPQEHLLEQRWLTQSQIDTTLAQRFGSHVHAWPIATERRTSVGPDDPDLAAGGTAKPLTGMRSAPLHDIATVPPADLTHIKLEWKATFGADKAVPDAEIMRCREDDGSGNFPAFSPAYKPTPPTTAADATAQGDEVRPDGYYHGPAAELAYTLRGGGQVDVLRDHGDVTHEMAARHLSLWIKPEGDWDSATYPGIDALPIFEARIPDPARAVTISTVGVLATTGASPTTDSQNYLGLFYDLKNRLLVLATAPPSAEHMADYWPSTVTDALFPMDDALTSRIDERSLSKPFAGGAALAPLAPRMYASGGPTAAMLPLFAPNRVLHLFKTPHDASGKPHFLKNQSYHVQLAITSNRPEGAAIILDGMVGQDIAKLGVAEPGLTNVGDHCVFPTLILGGSTSAAGVDMPDIPYIKFSAANVADLALSKITVSVPKILCDSSGALSATQLTANDLLPRRGMVRIDDEYIAYESIAADGKSLVNCVRGQRQNTNIYDPIDPSQLYPSTQAHRAGSLVVPGGYRLTVPKFVILPGTPNMIYRGGSVLAQDVTNGDTIPGANQWKVWGVVDSAQTPVVTVGPDYVLTRAAATDISLLAGSGVPLEFPVNGGVIAIVGNQISYRYYKTRTGNKLSGVQEIDSWNSVPAAPPSPTKAPPTDMSWPVPIPARIYLVSVHVNGKDPTELGRYSQRASGNAVQLQDPTGRIEWLGYDHILSEKPVGTGTEGFFIESTGFGPGWRGLQRTAFASKVPVLVGKAFATGSKALPVQTEIGGPGHFVATGDVVTLMPRSLSLLPTSPVPFQMAVRYAAGDGYTGPGDDESDSKNEFFAFSDFIPDSVPGQSPTDFSLLASAYEILCGTCWSGFDLTPLDPLAQPRAYLPRLDLWSKTYLSGAAAADKAHLWFGSDATGTRKTNLTIDCISAGKLCANNSIGPTWDGHDYNAANPSYGPNVVASGIERFFDGGNPTFTISGAATGMVAQATVPLFDFSLGKLGLVLIDGEVFAYQQLNEPEGSAIAAAMVTLKADPNHTGIGIYTAADIRVNGLFAKLIARGLIDAGDGGLIHTISDGPIILQDGTRRPRRPLLEAIRLPLGPVLRLNDPLVARQWATLTDSDIVPVPVMKLNAPSAMFCTPAGKADEVELIQLIGQNRRATSTGFPPVPVPNPDEGKYTTVDWLKGLYNTKKRTWTAADKAIVIGWWPRYASAMPQTPTKEHYACRSYAWVGFPVTVYGGYFHAGLLGPFSDTGLFGYRNERLADIKLSPDMSSYSDAFEVEARALADAPDWAAVHWQAQDPVVLIAPDPVAGTAGNSDATEAFSTKDNCLVFSDGGTPAVAKAVDGCEMRVSWRYAKTASSGLKDIAGSGNRTPIIQSARIRYLAPVRILANERAR
ncbi:MAG: hypothetical protein H0V44_03580, partial [Planctomycetes bacterium]|nr:hypothetical protein [Planctomycetota bacterium]